MGFWQSKELSKIETKEVITPQRFTLKDHLAYLQSLIKEYNQKPSLRLHDEITSVFKTVYLDMLSCHMMDEYMDLYDSWKTSTYRSNDINPYTYFIGISIISDSIPDIKRKERYQREYALYNFYQSIKENTSPYEYIKLLYQVYPYATEFIDMFNKANVYAQENKDEKKFISIISSLLYEVLKDNNTYLAEIIAQYNPEVKLIKSNYFFDTNPNNFFLKHMMDNEEMARIFQTIIEKTDWSNLSNRFVAIYLNNKWLENLSKYGYSPKNCFYYETVEISILYANYDTFVYFLNRTRNLDKNIGNIKKNIKERYQYFEKGNKIDKKYLEQQTAIESMHNLNQMSEFLSINSSIQNYL